ncbi:hypothetical protein [Euzebyella saccharophila]|uniref:Uncharacterized protein n=1 Tax=Euzebyella saccharophila TaxID=679664 RepID=A0ABV8JV74_9FLAO|nr:hypothetical protein [Euzebyella saccharophila]
MDAFSHSLSDTNPAASLSLKESLEKLNLQLASLYKAKTLATLAGSKLEGVEKDFFESNLVGQLEIVIGLGKWLQSCIYAKNAADNADWKTAQQYLGKALTAFDLIEHGKKLGSQGKWKGWYRGDKKMNTNAMKNRTEEVLNMLGEHL